MERVKADKSRLSSRQNAGVGLQRKTVKKDLGHQPYHIMVDSCSRVGAELVHCFRWDHMPLFLPKAFGVDSTPVAFPLDSRTSSALSPPQAAAQRAPEEMKSIKPSSSSVVSPPPAAAQHAPEERPSSPPQESLLVDPTLDSPSEPEQHRQEPLPQPLPQHPLEKPQQLKQHFFFNDVSSLSRTRPQEIALREFYARDCEMTMFVLQGHQLECLDQLSCLISHPAPALLSRPLFVLVFLSRKTPNLDAFWDACSRKTTGKCENLYLGMNYDSLSSFDPRALRKCWIPLLAQITSASSKEEIAALKKRALALHHHHRQAPTTTATTTTAISGTMTAVATTTTTTTTTREEMTLAGRGIPLHMPE